MAPHRLTRGNRLRALAREWLEQADDPASVPLRFRIIAVTPTVCIEYVVELLLTMAALSTGLFVLAGLSTSRVSEALPEVIRLAYALGLILGAVTVGWGLATKRYGTVVPIGLRLLCVVLAAYVVAVLGEVGFRGGAATIVMGIIFSGLAGWRSFLLRSLYLIVARNALRPPGSEL